MLAKLSCWLAENVRIFIYVYERLFPVGASLCYRLSCLGLGFCRRQTAVVHVKLLHTHTHQGFAKRANWQSKDASMRMFCMRICVWLDRGIRETGTRRNKAEGGRWWWWWWWYTSCHSGLVGDRTRWAHTPSTRVEAPTRLQKRCQTPKTQTPARAGRFRAEATAKWYVYCAI